MKTDILSAYIDIFLPICNPRGIQGLQIPQSRFPGLRKGIRDCSPYVRPFVHPLPNLWRWYFVNEWTNFDVNWHWWSAAQWHGMVNLMGHEAKDHGRVLEWCRNSSQKNPYLAERDFLWPILAPLDHDLRPPDSQSWPFHALVLPTTSANLHQSWLIHLQNIILKYLKN